MRRAPNIRLIGLCLALLPGGTVLCGAETAWPPAKWDAGHLVQAAVAGHPDLAVARAQVQAAVAARQTAGEKINPALNVSTAPVAGEKLKEGTYGFGMDFTLELGGKRKTRLSVAERQFLAAQAHLAEVEWTVRTGVRQSLGAAGTAAERVRRQRTALATQQEVVDGMEKQRQAGQLGGPALVPARLLLQQQKLALATAQGQLAQARVSVATAVGRPAADLAKLDLEAAGLSQPPAPPAAERARELALSHRADLKAATAEAGVAEAAVLAEVAKRHPDLHVIPGYEFDGGGHKVTLGFSLPLPLFSKNDGPIAEAEAKRVEAVAKLRAAETRALAGLDAALAEWQSAREKLETTRSIGVAQDKQLADAEALHKAGETDILSVLTARLERDTAAVSELDALAEVQAAWLKAEEALQTELSAPGKP